MLISIIVPVYNAEKYLIVAIESILNQTISDIELILIDDGSTDNSAKICDEYAEKDKRIKVVHHENRGVSKVRNEGLQLAKGKYIGFVDADDFIEKDMYEFLIKNITNYNCDISICGYTKKSEIDNSVDIVEVIENKDAMLRLLLQDGVEGYLWNKIIRRDLFYGIEFPNEISIAEDMYVLWEVLKKSKKICISSKICYHYIQHTNSLCNKNFSIKRLDILKVHMKLFEEGICLFEKDFNKIQTRIAEENISMALIMEENHYVNSDFQLQIKRALKSIKLKNILKMAKKKSWIIYVLALRINYSLFKIIYRFSHLKKERNVLR